MSNASPAILHFVARIERFCAQPGAREEGLPLTIALLGLMLVLWVLVKRRVLFWLIPR